MGLPNQSKINLLLQNWPKGTVALDPWIRKMGVYKQLKQKYIKSNWLHSIGHGAVVRTGDQVDWKGALYAIQDQLRLPIHIGGKTALEMQGGAHFLKLYETNVYLYSSHNQQPPSWFLNYHWGVQIHFSNSRFLKTEQGIDKIVYKDFELNISTMERAIFEMLYQVPENQSVEESFHIIEGMINLRPNLIQVLLESCTSVKVTRLFLCLSEKLNHSWFSRLDLSKCNLGHGNRSIVKNGVLDKKYKITLPRSLKDYD